MSGAVCVLNRCEREQGIGTWCYVDGKERPVCEEHWQALRDIYPRPMAPPLPVSSVFGGQ